MIQSLAGSAAHLLPRFPMRWSGGQIPNTYSSHGFAGGRPPRAPSRARPPPPAPPASCTASKADFSFSLSRLRSSCRPAGRRSGAGPRCDARFSRGEASKAGWGWVGGAGRSVGGMTRTRAAFKLSAWTETPSRWVVASRIQGREREREGSHLRHQWTNRWLNHQVAKPLVKPSGGQKPLVKPSGGQTVG